MMLQVTKIHIVLCLMIFHSTKSKNDVLFGFSTSKKLKKLYFGNSYAHTPETFSNQLYSSAK